MNAAAFRRAEALENLESYAKVIVIHLALVTWFPKHEAMNHWQAELLAFKRTLKRYDKGKKRPHNFSADLIAEILEDEIIDPTSQDSILIGIEGHGVMSPDEPDFKSLSLAIHDFAMQVVG